LKYAGAAQRQQLPQPWGTAALPLAFSAARVLILTERRLLSHHQSSERQIYN